MRHLQPVGAGTFALAGLARSGGTGRVVGAAVRYYCGLPSAASIAGVAHQKAHFQTIFSELLIINHGHVNTVLKYISVKTTDYCAPVPPFESS